MTWSISQQTKFVVQTTGLEAKKTSLATVVTPNSKAATMQARIISFYNIPLHVLPNKPKLSKFVNNITRKWHETRSYVKNSRPGLTSQALHIERPFAKHSSWDLCPSPSLTVEVKVKSLKRAEPVVELWGTSSELWRFLWQTCKVKVLAVGHESAVCDGRS